MKYCGYCGNSIPDDMIFCPKCGKKQSEPTPPESCTKSEESEQRIETEVPVQSTMEVCESLVKAQKKKSKKTVAIVIGIVAAVIIAGIAAIVLFLNVPKQNPVPSHAAELPQVDPSVPEPVEEPFTIVGNTEAIEKISRSVVKLTCYDKFGNEFCSGSGFFAFEDDLIVTNYHVIDGNVYSIKATSDGKEFSVEYLVNYNERYDLALLKVSHAEKQYRKLDFDPLPIGDSSTLNVSEHITAIGVPLGISKTVSDGMVSGFYEDNGVKLIQFTAPISHGSSGGALLNDRGEVVGITSASFSDGQNFNLTVPSSYINILYNATSKQQTISSFYNQFDHYYPVDYCLANYEKVSGNNITIYGFVSSFLRIETKEGQSRFLCYLVSDPNSIDGAVFRYIEGIDQMNYSKAQGEAILDRFDKEEVRCYNLENICISESSSYRLDDSILTPGNFILITGKINQATSKSYPGKKCLLITPSKIELAKPTY